MAYFLLVVPQLLVLRCEQKRLDYGPSVRALAEGLMTNQQSYPPIADYGLIGDMHSCALVSTNGSIDWCCFPRFDSPAIFGRILDWGKGGFFSVTLSCIESTSRRYLPNTNILETTFNAYGGSARLIDFMPVHAHSQPDQPLEIGRKQQIGRVLECTEGEVDFSVVCEPRFDYGNIVPHVEIVGPFSAYAHGGAHGLSYYCSRPVRIEDYNFVSDGSLQSGEKLYMGATYRSNFSHAESDLDPAEIEHSLSATRQFWEDWASVCSYQGEYRDEVVRSALTIKAMTYAPSGALLAAATTSLPEAIGGPRNWDYRFTWIRDAAFALNALVRLGYKQEGHAFKAWLEWSTVGRPADLQLMYGLGGERRLTETELPELEGYKGSKPVRVGNGAFNQFQLDVYGELMESADLHRRIGFGEIGPKFWQHLTQVVNFVIGHWCEPDDGIWETRGGRQHFVYSKVMCWVALDRAIKTASDLNLPTASAQRWQFWFSPTAVRD